MSRNDNAGLHRLILSEQRILHADSPAVNHVGMCTYLCCAADNHFVRIEDLIHRNISDFRRNALGFGNLKGMLAADAGKHKFIENRRQQPAVLEQQQRTVGTLRQLRPQ